VLQVIIENYEEYKDYNTTTAQSDYGENLYVLLDFLRLKVSYDRHAWHFRPLVLAHEVVARCDRRDAAVFWEEAFVRLTRQLAAQHLEDLARCERTHGLRLSTVADHLQERFVKPLALDRLCALIEPAMTEARQGQEPVSFTRLEQELQPLAARPTGVGLDVPQWLRRLEMEVHRVHAGSSAIAGLAEKHFRLPKVLLSYEEFERQLAQWDNPEKE
jgi:hypothetical protein